MSALALLFPGQGSQVVGMGRDVYEASDAARAVFDTADAILGFPLSRLCFEGPEQELQRTEVQQPAILTVAVALLRALEAQTPVSAAYVAGHSLGEYTALVASGAVRIQRSATLVAEARGQTVLRPAPITTIRELATRHRHEGTLGTFDDLQIPNHEGIVDGHAAVSAELVARIHRQLDADFGDVHGPPIPSCQ